MANTNTDQVFQDAFAGADQAEGIFDDSFGDLGLEFMLSDPQFDPSDFFLPGDGIMNSLPAPSIGEYVVDESSQANTELDIGNSFMELASTMADNLTGLDSMNLPDASGLTCTNISNWDEVYPGFSLGNAGIKPVDADRGGISQDTLSGREQANAMITIQDTLFRESTSYVSLPSVLQRN
ncbi:unnamed protein product [Clonostachys solani]|uniref:Uncharacterized protein n=1 Tax=Clonostachys solani TaxID=160281 RepID=A0A9P0EN15_9HYPO|nr:unnamed protein product [Clonostachys solani]